MIANINGTVQQIGEGYLIVQVGGVGLRVSVPNTVLENVDAVGRAIMLYTHLHLRENNIALFGFVSKDERELFDLLLAVSGVGPKLALAVLSTLSPDVLTGAVAREEPDVLQRVSGIGKKTAERILFQLRDKLKVDQLPAGLMQLSDLDAEVIAALTSLGYSVVEAQAAVQRLPRDSTMELEERIRLALSGLGS